MDNKTFAISANKFFFYAMNYRCVEVEIPDYGGIMKKNLPDFFNAMPMYLRTHLAGKWDALYDTHGPYGAIMAFYAELDGNLRAQMLKWINENFKQDDSWGISIKDL